MVCDRCKVVLHQELDKAGISVVSLELGELVVMDENTVSKSALKEITERNGFEIIEQKSSVIVEKVKFLLIQKIEKLESLDEKTSSFLTRKLNMDYSSIGKTFSANAGLTIEKYLIRLKLEKAKELLQMDAQSFSEIAYSLGYSSGSHLAKQFKNSAGMSMTEYKRLQKWNRKTLDKIV